MNRGASFGPGAIACGDGAQEVSAHSGDAPSRVILDACCGSRMFWFDRQHPLALFADNRCERHELPDVSSPGGSRTLVIDPDLLADFTALPLPADHFALVVFDPPHLVGSGRNSWLAKKYGKLGADWRDDLRKGFVECFRVLRPEGVLIFKWNEHDVKVSEVLALTPAKPLFGNRCGKTAKSHWLVFMKGRDTDGSGEAGQTAKQAGPVGREPGPQRSEGIAHD